ncbi:hypothetical protein DN752_11870 [Echinicola strongylocentroti]|uniref:Uncharacterized protein n=1 Tax=Echinicola strongylocentroti TaxID=1795355 RepID=A0A2Z4IIJ1_9BACT|nr:hypothetical protein [Echinicola strongylocentroti]AWW30764.1 hypothetical protein DN752_11870 [Echinicola strongylocentroti]
MGYMGFGMRKEDYKRKPRKTLELYKDVYGNDHTLIEHDQNAPQLTKDEVLHKSRVRSLFEWKGFLVLKIVVLLVIMVIMIIGLIS